MKKSKKVEEKDLFLEVTDDVKVADDVCGKNDDERYDEKEAEEFEKEIEEEITKFDKKEIEEDVFVGSSIEMFMKDLRNYPLLSVEQERKLTKILACGKSQEKKIARERLLLCNLRLVVYAAKKYRGRGVPFEDLISEGYIGLSKGIDKFDYKRGFKLSTFVLYWIKQAVSRAVDDQGRTVRLPVHINDKLNKYKKVKNELTSKLGYEPSIEEIAKKMKVSVESLERLINSSMDTLSLDKYVGEDEDVTFGEMIADNTTISPEDFAKSSAIRERLIKAMSELKEKERYILELRHGFNDENPKTLEQIGDMLHITRERVRQIENIAIRKLKNKVKDLEELVA